MKPVALIIDDEVQIRRLLRVALEAENYQVREAENGQQGLIEIANYKPAVILLDLGLPDLEGLEVLRRLREWSEAPVVVLTVRDDVQEKVAALDAGADDYVTKPFSIPELLARLRAAQRKTRPAEEISVFKHGDLIVDLSAHTVTRAGQGSETDRHRVRLAPLVCQASWPRSHAPLHLARNLGSEIGRTSAVSPRLRHASAPKDRERSSEAVFNQNRAWNWLPICGLMFRARRQSLRANRNRSREKQLASEQVRNGESHAISDGEADGGYCSRRERGRASAA